MQPDQAADGDMFTGLSSLGGASSPASPVHEPGTGGNEDASVDLLNFDSTGGAYLHASASACCHNFLLVRMHPCLARFKAAGRVSARLDVAGYVRISS